MTNRLWHFLGDTFRPNRGPSQVDLLKTENEILRNAVEQALLLLSRDRFKIDSEVKVVRPVLRNALEWVDYR